MLAKYKYLLTYRYALIIYDGNAEFCHRHVNKFSRTYDQMIQGGRSGKQNIIEAVGESQTTKSNEIKLLGYSLGSYEELIGDYEDFLRMKKLVMYPKTHPRVQEYRKLGYRLSDLSNLSDLGELKEKLTLPDDSEEAANLMLTLLHIETYLLDKQIKSMITKFEKEGGFSEQLLRGRLKKRV